MRARFAMKGEAVAVFAEVLAVTVSARNHSRFVYEIACCISSRSLEESMRS